MKNYILDTNILLTDPNAIKNLLDENTNKVTIPIDVLLELDKLKNDMKVGYLARNAVHEIIKYKDLQKIEFSGNNDEWILNYLNTPDGRVLSNFINNKIDKKDNHIFLTNDNIFALLSNEIIQNKKIDITVDQYKTIGNYISDPILFNGFLKSSNIEDNFINVANYFTKEDGKYYFNSNKGKRSIIEQKVWGISPRHITQKLAIDLMLNDDMKIVSVQSAAGAGKSLLALAVALYETFEKKKYERIMFVKPMYEIGSPLGFLPGDINDKISCYFEYALDLLLFLHEKRRITRVFSDPSNDKKINEKFFKFLPLNFIRGMNINNTLLICDEFQLANKHELKSILSRCGEGTKAIICGDIQQIDIPTLNIHNNAISTLVRNMITHENYAHIVLDSKHSRGPVADMILKSGI